MPLSLSATDPRGPRAVTLASQADQWTRTGSAYRIHGYRASAHFCSCPAFRFATDGFCKHSLAAALLDELSNEQAAF